MEGTGHKKSRILCNEELSAFCLQLSMLLRAGVTPGEALASMIAESGSAEEKDLLAAAARAVESGETLSAALAAAERFPRYMTDMLRVGELTGRMEQVTRSLAAHYEREGALSGAVRRAVLYPGSMALVLVVVVFALLTHVLPIFETVYRELGSELPALARVLMRAGDVLRSCTAVFAVLVAAVTITVLLAVYTPAGRPISAILSRWTGKTALALSLARARYASVMALMLSSGFDMGEAAESAVQLVGNETVQAAAAACAQAVAAGGSFADEAERAELFTGIDAALLRAGFRTGQGDAAMEEVARLRREDAQQRLDRAVGRIEPALVILLSVLVGAILLSVMLPLLSVLSAR